VRSEIKWSQGKELLFAVTSWHPYEGGAGVGIVCSESGVTAMDDAHPAVARITLE